MELIERIAPLMKEDGAIVLVVREPRSIDGGSAFADTVDEALRRKDSAARIEQVRCVPASGLRAWCYRTFARLGTDAHQRPWLGLPALALFAAPLAFLTLAANLFAAARTRSTFRGRTASSLHLILRMASGE